MLTKAGFLFSWLCFFGVIAAAESTTVATKKGSTFQISWDYQNFPFRISLYDLKNPKIIKVGSTGRLKNRTDSLLANPIVTPSIWVPEGDRYIFALAVENTSNRKFYFHVVPHEVTPIEYSLGTKFNCLCYGHIYSVGPGQTWYRIVSLQNVTPSLGTQFAIRHKVIGLDQKFYFKDAKEFQETM